MQFFATKRANNVDGGVAVPSQRRYVKYFDKIIKRQIYPSFESVKVFFLIIIII